MDVFKYAFLHALLTAAYIFLIGLFLFYAPETVEEIEPNVLIPVAMLMLFVFSAALTGSLLFGRPVLWYLDGKKKEALSLAISTLGILFVFTLLFIFLLFSVVA